MQYQGIAILMINGREIPTLKGATLETGGEKRNPVTGQRVYGWQAEYVPARISCQLPNGSDLSIADINALTDVTVVFKADVGKQWLLPNAWNEGASQLSDNGNVSTAFAAVEAKEI